MTSENWEPRAPHEGQEPSVEDTIRLHSAVLWDAERRAARTKLHRRQEELLAKMREAREQAGAMEEVAWGLLEGYTDFGDPELDTYLVEAAASWAEFAKLAEEVANEFGRYWAPGGTTGAHVSVHNDGYYRALHDAAERYRASLRAAEQ